MMMVIAAGLVLTACGGGKLGSLKADCKTVVADPEAAEAFEENGLTADSFCDCMVTTVSNQSETIQTKVLNGMATVAKGMKESGTGADDVVDTLRDAGQSDDADAEVKALWKDVDFTGDMLGDLIEGMAENGGQCTSK